MNLRGSWEEAREGLDEGMGEKWCNYLVNKISKGSKSWGKSRSRQTRSAKRFECAPPEMTEKWAAGHPISLRQNKNKCWAGIAVFAYLSALPGQLLTAFNLLSQLFLTAKVLAFERLKFWKHLPNNLPSHDFTTLLASVVSETSALSLRSLLLLSNHLPRPQDRCFLGEAFLCFEHLIPEGCRSIG